MFRLNTKIRLTMLCLSGFELYSRWVPLIIELSDGNICLNFAVHTALEQTLTFIYSYKRQSLTLSEENSKIKRLQELL